MSPHASWGAVPVHALAAGCKVGVSPVQVQRVHWWALCGFITPTPPAFGSDVRCFCYVQEQLVAIVEACCREAHQDPVIR